MPKLNTKTIVLAGTEQEIRLSGQNCDIRNDGTDTVYASGEPNIIAGADGVMSIPAGQAVQIRDFGGVMYLLGTGSVQICGHDYQTPVFKCAPASGGSGTVDQTARDTLNQHANNLDIHLTAEDVAELVSNGNQLINPDFSINQRGLGSYSSAGFTVDGWQVYTTQSATSGTFSVTPTENGVVIDNQTNGNLLFFQHIEKFRSYFGREIAVSAKANGQLISASGTPDDVTGFAMYASDDWGGIGYYTTANTHSQAQFIVASGKSVALEHVKLEHGALATAFMPPEPSTELLKCQRYYQVHSTGAVDPVDLRPTMAAITDIRQRGDGNYEYIAEL